MPQIPTTIQTILDKTDAVIQDYAMNGYDFLVESLTDSLRLLLIISTALIGFAMLYSRAGMSAKTGVSLFLKMMIIYIILTQWSEFDKYFHDVFTNSPNMLVATVLQNHDNNTQTSINSELDKIYFQGFEVARKIREQGGLTSIGPLFYSVIIIATTLLMIGYVTFILVLAKVGVAILLVLAPVFIPMLLFSSTRGLFQSWLGNLINFALLPLLTYTLLVLVIFMISDSMTEMMDKIDGNEDLTMTQIAPYLLISVIGFLLFVQIRWLAKNIGGGLMNGMKKVPEKIQQSYRVAAPRLQRITTQKIVPIAKNDSHLPQTVNVVKNF